MKPLLTLSKSARYAVIHSVYHDQSITVEETSSKDYAVKVVIKLLQENYEKSGYITVRKDDYGTLYVYDQALQPIAKVVLISIQRRLLT